MKIYIAASLPRYKDAHNLSQKLKQHGHEIVSIWHKNDKILGDTKADYHSGTKAARDMHGVKNCELFIELVGDNKSRGGRHCELGLALAWDKQIILIGDVDDCIFTHLPILTHIQTIEQFLKERINIGEENENRI